LLRGQGTGVMDFGKTRYEEVNNLLRTCYGETGVKDFGFNTAHKIYNNRLYFMNIV